MSFGFASLVSDKPSSSNEDTFIPTEKFQFGNKRAIETVTKCHPLILHQQRFNKEMEQIHLRILQNEQGIHAPIRLMMEQRAVKNIGHLPFMKSYNVLQDSLTGRDLEITPEDIYNNEFEREQFIQPHAMMEKNSNIL